MSYGVGCRCGLNPTLLWLWHRLVATAPIRPIAWEPPYAKGVALEKTKDKKNKQKTYFRVFCITWKVIHDKLITEKRKPSSHCCSAVTNPTSILEDTGSIPGLAQWVKDLAWLWRRLAAAAPIQSLGWELPHAACAALKSKKNLFS